MMCCRRFFFFIVSEQSTIPPWMELHGVLLCCGSRSRRTGNAASDGRKGREGKVVGYIDGTILFDSEDYLCVKFMVEVLRRAF